jgi:cytochrome bd-type quinol oxidase subunit 2
MTKLLWVVVPLLVALAAWAMLGLRGRAPSRQALNVWSSLLLVAYVLSTAGLGVFWVASQQLPSSTGTTFSATRRSRCSSCT